MARRSTIAAIATPPGPGVRGVIRLSGPQSIAIVRRCASFEDSLALTRRGAWRGRFDDGRGTQPLLALAMPGPASFTREDVVELHLCGSPPLVAAALERVVALGAELARPGEFTRRAFESGRIDLSQAEGVLELVEAANEGERRAATELLFGGLQQRLAALRGALLDLRVLCEASLDFDEADTGHVPHAELVARTEAVSSALDEALAWERRRTRRQGLARVALVGAPNAGKSTLWNALVGGSALTSEVAGTTRDALCGRLQLGELECELVDTAGRSRSFEEREEDHPDRRAQRLAQLETETADLVVRVYDARGPAPEAATGELLVRAQSDRGGPGGPGIAVCAPRGEGLGALKEALARALCGAKVGAGTVRELGERHRAALALARERVEEARDLLGAHGPLDLAAECLRQALDALDGIGGRTSPEDVLDALFARFCIGK
jgi:tRNA modification GTPase